MEVECLKGKGTIESTKEMSTCGARGARNMRNHGRQPWPRLVRLSRSLENRINAIGCLASHNAVENNSCPGDFLLYLPYLQTNVLINRCSCISQITIILNVQASSTNIRQNQAISKSSVTDIYLRLINFDQPSR